MNAPVKDWDLLLHRHLEGILTPEEGVQLSDRLRKDARLRLRLAEMAFDQAQFREIFQPEEAGAALPEAAPVAAPSRSGRLLALAAAALFLAAGGVVLWKSGGPAKPYELVSGTVREEAGGLLATGPAPAVLRLGGRSRVELLPDSAAAFRGPASLDLARGSGRFDLPDSFRVDTPLGSVTSLASEFRLDLRKGGKPQSLVVSVSRGRVRVDLRGRRTELGAGESRLFDGGESKEPRADPWKGWNGILEGRRVARGDEGTLFRVERIIRGEAMDGVKGTSIRLTSRVPTDAGSKGPDRSGALLDGFGADSLLIVEARHLKGDLFDLVGDRNHLERLQKLGQGQKSIAEEEPAGENREK